MLYVISRQLFNQSAHSSLPLCLNLFYGSIPLLLHILLAAAGAIVLGSTIPLPSAIATPFTTLPGTSLFNQLLQIPRFTGEDTSNGETFQDWLEQLGRTCEVGEPHY